MPWLDTTNKTFSLLIKIVLLFIIIGGVSWIVVSCGANLWWLGDSPDLPDIEKAKYQLFIKNTSELIFTDDYDTDGGIYTLHGYYELKEGKYKFHDKDIQLDPQYFGPIQVKKR